VCGLSKVREAVGGLLTPSLRNTLRGIKLAVRYEATVLVAASNEWL
jgi:hypothetical protein